MRYFEQRDYREIAARLGCSEAGARSHVSRALANMKTWLARVNKR